MSSNLSASVGPFWFIRTDSGVILIARPCPLGDAETYGDFLTGPDGHYNLWEGWRTGQAPEGLTSIVRDFEYEEWPRGRVVFNFVRNVFILYGDKQIFKHKLQHRVLEHFGIATAQVEFSSDGHYQSTQTL